jgi:hypothetical protein
VLTVTFHAHCQALLETTVLAPVPVILVNLTVARATALVAHLLPAPDKNRVRQLVYAVSFVHYLYELKDIKATSDMFTASNYFCHP